LSKYAIGIVSVIAISTVIGSFLSWFSVVAWLDFLYYLSYLKLLLTILKYVPQAYLNYSRKSTVGWSIFNVILDFSGGILSISQILLDSFITGHWGGILGYLTKLVLGIITIIFDTLFLTQHYYWYPERSGAHVVDVDVYKKSDELNEKSDEREEE